MRHKRRWWFIEYWSEYFQEVRFRWRERRRGFAKQWRFFFARPFRNIWEPIRDRLQYWKEKRAESKMHRKAWFAYLWDLTTEWFIQPRWIYLLKGLPALLVAGTIAGLIVSARANVSTRAQTYQKVAREGLAGENYDLSQVAYERLCRDFPTLPEYRYGLAMTALAKKDFERGNAILQEIAPADKPGYNQAHLFLASQHMQFLDRGPEQFVMAENHLLRAIQSQGDSATAQVLLGQLYLRNNRPGLAERYLKDAEATIPDASLLLARLYSEQKRTDQSRAYASRARERYQLRLKEEPDNLTLRIALCEAFNLLGQYSESVDTLRSGMERKDGVELRAMLGKTLSQWVEEPKVGLLERLALIEQGLRLVPNSPMLLDKLVQTTRMDGEAGEKARQQLNLILANGGQNLSTLYLVLGVDAQKRNLPDQALHYLEKAFEKNPQMAVVANNLAWVLAQGDKPDLPRALSLANEAVKRSPKDLHFRDTRGQILAKMGRWKEALEDLEPCVPSFANSLALHRTLAEVYGKLNMPEPAKAHEKLANNLSSKSKPD